MKTKRLDLYMSTAKYESTLEVESASMTPSQSEGSSNETFYATVTWITACKSFAVRPLESTDQK